MMNTGISGRNRFLVLSSFLLFVMIYIYKTIPYGLMLLMGLLPVMLLVFFTNGNGFGIPVSNAGFIIYLGAFVLFGALSVFWSEMPDMTMYIEKQMLVILIEITVLCICHSRDTSVDPLLKIMMYGGYTVIMYATFRFGWSQMMDMLSDETRVRTELINANVLGMCAAFAIIINVHYLLYEGLKLRDVLIVPATVILAASGSRKAIVILIVGILMVIALRYANRGNIVNNLIKGLIVLTVVVIAIIMIYNLPVFATIQNRMEGLVEAAVGAKGGDGSSTIRFAYKELGKKIFLEHPLLGIGLHSSGVYITAEYSQTHTYLHDNFVELLACGGIVGFALHYSIYAYLFYRFWRFRKQRTKEYDICLIILIIKFLMGYGYVQYSLGEEYFFLLICYLLVDQMRTNGVVYEGGCYESDH